MHIVDIEQQAAARARSNRAEEFDLSHAAGGETQIVGGVFDQDGAAEPFLHLVDMVRNAPERRLVARQRQQVGQIAAAMARPGEMLGNARRPEPGNQMRQTVQMLAVERAFRPDGKAHAVAGNREPVGETLQPGNLCAAVHHVVFRVDLDPGDRAGRGEDGLRDAGAYSRRRPSAAGRSTLCPCRPSRVPFRQAGAGVPRPGPVRDAGGAVLSSEGRGRALSREPLRSPGSSMVMQVPLGTSVQALP